MLFSSVEFFFFFALYLAAHILTPLRWRIHLIVAGSTVFYAWWNPVYVFVPYLLIALGYGGGLWLGREADGPGRKAKLALLIALMLAPLAFYKYTDFLLVSVVGPFAGIDRPVLALPLPLGISFVTFTVISYAVDVYRREFPVERGPLVFAGYILFFPQLIAGPILRPWQLIPQLLRPRPAFNRIRLTWPLGALIFAVGLAKKLVIADQIGLWVEPVYAQPEGQSLAAVWLAIHAFSAQIYCDFSGYTDMAIGLAMILGVRLPNNFQRPYAATSIVQFWRRWHITLSRWLRDYLYIPLGGGRVPPLRRGANVMATMLLGGLWHGAAWNFVIWGGLHGLFIVVTQKLGRLSPFRRCPRWLAILFTYHLAALAWVFFRAPEFGTALAVLKGAFSAPLGDLEAFAAASAYPLLLLAIFFASHGFDHHGRLRLFARRAPGWAVGMAIFFLVALSMVISQGSSAEFIYFDF
jgi:alginate O-acetyltransferase complex protein AlgI